MSIVKNAVKSGIWYAAFRLITQIFSWLITIIVARLLEPEDYGLMSMASILTGYVEVFSELGLGAAIIQRKNITQKELSSNFWFSIGLGCLFATLSFFLAYPTAWVFREQRVVPITQIISMLFIIGAVMVVPYNILQRELRFKTIGLVNFLAVVISSSSMLFMAYRGFGVWTLINGTIILRMATVLLVMKVSKWKPDIHFQWSEVRSFLSFGLYVAGSRSFFYFFQRADVLIVGRLLGTQSLGYYSLALQLASTPTNRIISMVNQVLFPVFSRFQDDLIKKQGLYLRMTKYIALFVVPLFLSGAIWGDEIIRTMLDQKWIPLIFLFKIFCLAQVFASFSSINGIVHSSEGKLRRVLGFSVIHFLLMSVSYFIAARYTLNAMAVPWIVVYPALCLGFTWFTLRVLKIRLFQYVEALAKPSLVSGLIILGIKGTEYLIHQTLLVEMSYKAIFFQEVLTGMVLYGAYLFIMEKQTLIEMWNIRKA
ncbi:MAG: lipopolysaccharide biosynthesis protein [Nitrospiria bacterium]